MATLRDVLADTVLGQAAPSAPLEPAVAGAGELTLQLRSANDARTTQGLTGKQAFDPAAPGPWSFDFAVRSSGPEVTALDCLAPCEGMAPMAARVCDRISFGDVRVTLQGKTFELPLTPDFVIAHTALREDGRLAAGANRFFALETAINFGVQVTFGFELRGGKITPIAAAVREVNDFTDFTASRGASVRITLEAGKTGRRKILGTPARFLVSVSFSAHKPRNDFEPQGVLLAGRLVPAVYVRANCELSQAEARVTMQRPSTSSMAGMMKDVDPEIGSVFFTDRNNAGLAAPIWPEIFDYYLLPNASGFEGNSPGPGEFAAVHAIRGGDPTFAKVRTLDGKRRVHPGIIPVPHLGGPADVDGEPGDYGPGKIVKTAGQGEFDSVHMAPKMVVPSGKLKGFKAAMAPICAHDCLHTHWRWSFNYAQTQDLGWDQTGSYRKRGAPMVPQNQDVRINPTGACGFEYRATCKGPIPANEWQVVFAHGSAYSLAMMVDSWKNAGLSDAIRMVGFPLLYTMLRYGLNRLPHLPSPGAAAAAATAAAGGQYLLALWILLEDQKGSLMRSDLTEYLDFSAAELAAMRAL